MHDKIYQKNCPDCNKPQIYSNRHKLWRAKNTNASCRDCSRKKPSKKRQDLTGNIYGRLKVLSFYEKRGKDQYWKCECKCGNETIIRHSHLTKQTIRSCGCVHYYTNNKHPSWIGYEEIPGTYFCAIRRSAKKRNLVFHLTLQEIWDLFLKQNRRCALSGELLTFNKEQKDTSGTASLDRIDSNKGYTIDNVQWLHKKINVMKQDLTDIEFVKYCQTIAVYRKDLL